MLELRVSRHPSPLGPLLVVESDRGLVAIEIDPARQAALEAHLRARLGPDFSLRTVSRSRAGSELAAYFSGRRRRFDIAVDWSTLAGFQREVLRALARVPFGELVTYGELARAIKKPAAARAIGGAMAKNPIPIVLPCHRVVASDGSLGGFSAGSKVKQWLHAHEGIEPLPGGWTTRAEREGRGASIAHRVQKRRSARPSRSTTT